MFSVQRRAVLQRRFLRLLTPFPKHTTNLIAGLFRSEILHPLIHTNPCQMPCPYWNAGCIAFSEPSLIIIDTLPSTAATPPFATVYP
ncbi:hypothetical protein B0H67DRAFT_254733 [Lasiosphaeris hirsuta]|uniref:Uncharacterized protein n=1 Tax=Lasiosphaeris hirsuta TaxID=260670 RepID=A0AA40DY51_9PEZI|nr:hypothetical protein B0H67DRAFT_254733 [Lasiosphaeris hirsuta]